MSTIHKKKSKFDRVLISSSKRKIASEALTQSSWENSWTSRFFSAGMQHIVNVYPGAEFESIGNRIVMQPGDMLFL